MTYLTSFIEFFRFIKHAHERAERRYVLEAEERAAERAHQRALLETIFTKMADSQRIQADGLMSIADASRANADVMKTWLDGFKISDPTPQRPQVATADEEDWVGSKIRLEDYGLTPEDLKTLPADFPEFNLAFGLEHDGDPESDT